MISGDIYSASAMSFSLCRQRRSPLFQHRNNVGGMSVLLHHAATSLINFTPSAVRSQRGDLSPSVKFQTSSHRSPVAHITKPEFQVRWRWQPNDIAIWDNRVTQHYANADYLPQRRIMHRATILGDIPFYRAG